MTSTSSLVPIATTAFRLMFVLLTLLIFVS